MRIVQQGARVDAEPVEKLQKVRVLHVGQPGLAQDLVRNVQPPYLLPDGRLGLERFINMIETLENGREVPVYQVCFRSLS